MCTMQPTRSFKCKILLMGEGVGRCGEVWGCAPSVRGSVGINVGFHAADHVLYTCNARFSVLRSQGMRSIVGAVSRFLVAGMALFNPLVWALRGFPS